MECCSDCEIIKADVPMPDFTFKVIIVGDAGVGKSCILYRASTGKFKEDYDVTLSAEYTTMFARIKESYIKLQIWDTL